MNFWKFSKNYFYLIKVQIFKIGKIGYISQYFYRDIIQVLKLVWNDPLFFFWQSHDFAFKCCTWSIGMHYLFTSERIPCLFLHPKLFICQYIFLQMVHFISRNHTIFLLIEFLLWLIWIWPSKFFIIHNCCFLSSTISTFINDEQNSLCINIFEDTENKIGFGKSFRIGWLICIKQLHSLYNTLPVNNFLKSSCNS